MKNITIPKRFGYPTVDIAINGNEETFQSGVEISVDDSVAEVIKNAIALEPKQGRNISRLAQLANGTLTEITSSDLEGIENIAYCAFAQCYSLTRVEIPNSVKMIKENALTGCIKLESVIFGDNSKLDNIAKNAFYYCTNLARVHLPLNPPTLENINAFADIKASCVFYCKTQESLEAYKKAPNWSALTETYSFVVEDE